jgi:O-antigen/teichoic acid export membrane protein
MHRVTQAAANPADSSAPQPSAPGPAAMGGAVMRGSLWMLFNTLVSRGASLVAQILLGRILLQDDFGVYALAISASTMAAVLKDGGVKQVLIQRQREYEGLIGPVFWMAGAFNLATGLIIVLLAHPLAWAYHEPRVAWLMLVIAVCQPLSTPGAILATRLQIDLRFREAGLIAAISSIIRYLGAVVLAYMGFGAMSFVLPLPLLAFVEWGLGWWYARERPWQRSARPDLWWTLFRDTRWILAGTIGIAGINLGANMVIGFFVAMAVVGVYFFAFQIVVQIGMVLAGNVVQVLFAAFSKIAEDVERKRSAALRSLRQIMLLSGPMCLGLAATFTPLELIFWKGKWAEAANPVEIIGLFYPATMAGSVALAVMQARGRFRAWGLCLLGMALATLVSAALGASLQGTASGIALYTGAGSMLASLAVTVYGLEEIGIGLVPILRAISPAWLLSIVAAVAAVAVDQRFLVEAHPILRLTAIGAIFCAVFAILARLLIPHHLREALAVSPARVRPLASTFLWLR